jgi:ribosome-binding factor A
MAGTIRKQRIEAYIMREVGGILLTEMKDPRLGLVSVTRVKVSKDLRNARIMVSVLGGDEEKARTMKVLRGARGFIQHRVAQSSDLRIVPEFRFALDESIEKSIRVSQLIDEAVAEDRRLAEERGETYEDPETAEPEEEGEGPEEDVGRDA